MGIDRLGHDVSSQWMLRCTAPATCAETEKTYKQDGLFLFFMQ
jgi:hypothetical protein